MKALILAACAVSVPCLADDGIPWMTPHVVDTGVSAAVLQAVPGAVELNPLGFPGVVVSKFAMEGIALGYRDAGDVETCQAVAGGARWGGWIGTGATLGGLEGSHRKKWPSRTETSRSWSQRHERAVPAASWNPA